MQEVMAGDGSDGAVVNRRSNGVAVQASGGKGRIVQGDAVSPGVKQPDHLGSRSLHTLDGGADADVPVRQSDAGKFGVEQYGDLLHQAGLDWNAGELSEIGLRVPSNIAENRSMAAPNVTAIPSGSMNAAGPQQTAVAADVEGYARRLQEVMPELAAEEINWVNDFGETSCLISQRNNAVGRPSAIVQFDVELNSRQKQLIEKLPEYNASVVVGKDNVNMADLAALTAKTGCEYAMFTRGSQRLIIRGNGTSVDVNIDKAIELMQNGYKWSGHTHPGNDRNCLIASGADYEILKAFNQKQSVTYNSNGQYLVYEVGE